MYQTLSLQLTENLYLVVTGLPWIHSNEAEIFISNKTSFLCPNFAYPLKVTGASGGLLGKIWKIILTLLPFVQTASFIYLKFRFYKKATKSWQNLPVNWCRFHLVNVNQLGILKKLNLYKVVVWSADNFIRKSLSLCSWYHQVQVIL